MNTRDDDKPTASRRIWGRGFYDGLRAAGITSEEELMHAAKMQRLERGLSTQARKVLDATPMREAWTISQIITEHARLTGTHPDHKTVAGCLNSLVSDGLVREVGRGTFIRVTPKQAIAEVAVAPTMRIVPNIEEKPMPTIEVKAQPPKPDPVAMLADLARRMREMAIACDEAAAAVDKRLQQMGGDSEQLRELREMLQRAVGVL